MLECRCPLERWEEGEEEEGGGGSGRASVLLYVPDLELKRLDGGIRGERPGELDRAGRGGRAAARAGGRAGGRAGQGLERVWERQFPVWVCALGIVPETIKGRFLYNSVDRKSKARPPPAAAAARRTTCPASTPSSACTPTIPP